MKKAAPKRDARIADLMIQNGVPNHSKCLFLALIALAAKETHSETLKSRLKLQNNQVHRMAAKLVIDYLKRVGARVTLQLVQTEGDLHYFSTYNKESIDPLQLLLNRPPIQKLIRMRYAQVRRIESDDETHGWFDIESELSGTIAYDTRDGSTYAIDTIAYRDRDINDDSSRNSRQKRSAINFTIPESVQAESYARDKKSFVSRMSARSMRDAMSQPVQLIGDQLQMGRSYEEGGSVKIIPQSNSERRGRRSQNNE